MGFQNGWRGPDIVADGLVLYLDAGSPNSYRPDFGTTWKDMSGFNNSGSLINGPTYSSANGGSIVFDGSNDYVEIPHFNITNEITISIWVYLLNNNQWRPLIGNWNNGGNGDSWLLLPNSFYTTDVSNSINGIIYNNSEPNINTWYNFVGIFNRGEMIMYQNNIEVAKNSNVGFNTLYQNVLKIWIGRFSSFYIQALIPTSLVYNRALSAQEVLQNYNVQKSRFGL
jgi:hypothetical protein